MRLPQRFGTIYILYSSRTSHYLLPKPSGTDAVDQGFRSDTKRWSTCRVQEGRAGMHERVGNQQIAPQY